MASRHLASGIVACEVPEWPRNVAGNPDVPQAVFFLTSIIDTLVGVETYFIHYDSV